MSGRQQGRLVVLSGPSGAGKSTLLRLVLERSRLPLVLSVSATTRPPRPGEVDGVDYHFLTAEEFDCRRRQGEFLECFQVFGRDHWYGTLHAAVAPVLEAGKWVILEIDVQGAMSVGERYPDAITIFVRPASFAELENRLRGRKTETPEVIQRRLERARHEWTLADRYRHEVINDDLDRAAREICNILQAEADSYAR